MSLISNKKKPPAPADGSKLRVKLFNFYPERVDSISFTVTFTTNGNAFSANLYVSLTVFKFHLSHKPS